jgi:hypothetical protein
VSSIEHLLSAVRRRERLADTATGLRWALPAGLLVAAVCLVAIKRLGAPAEILWLTGLPLPILAGWVLWRPRSLRAAARRIDSHYGLDDEIGNAYELATSAPRGVSGNDPRTSAIVELLTEAAEQRAKTVDPRPVVPMAVPALHWVDAVAVLAVLGALFVPRPEPQLMQRWFAAPQLDALLTLPTRAGLDLALADPLRQNLRGLSDDEDEAAKIAQKILETLDKLESGELDRAEAFAELERLEELLREAEEEFEAKLDEDPGMLADAMRDLAETLEEHEITEKAGEALDDGRPEDAQEALDEAAEKAAEGSQAEQDAARKAMEAAERSLNKSAKQNKSDTDEQLDEAERRLRREQKKKNPADPEEHERRLKKMKERVEQLRRQQQREQAAQRRLDQLKRDAADAANGKKNGQQRKRSMQKLSRGASGAAKKSRQASRMRQIRDAMDEAKTFVRRAGKQGDSAKRRRQQFRRFSKAANGKKGKKGKKGKGKTTLMVEGDIGDGQPDMFMEGDGQGQDGQGQEGDGQGQDGQGDAQGQGQDGGQGQMPGGDGIGDGSVDPRGDEQGIDTSKKTVHVNAREGRGVSRAEVISESSQEGFATEAYRDVFTDYRRFAQSALDNEALPPAQRRAVKRYYQLISPRQ